MTEKKTNIDDSADKLNEALDLATDLFARHFRASARVTLPSGSELAYRKDGSKGYALLYNDGPLTSASLGRRVEAAAHLAQLWRACSGAEDELRRGVEIATAQVLGFVKTVGGAP